MRLGRQDRPNPGNISGGSSGVRMSDDTQELTPGVSGLSTPRVSKKRMDTIAEIICLL